jgi:phenylacetate-CoA ligase
LAGVTASHYDTLETLDPQSASALFSHGCPGSWARAQRSAHYREVLKDLDLAAFGDRAALARLPIAQVRAACAPAAVPPFGGLLATPCRVSRLFMSPGPIYDPEAAVRTSGSPAYASRRAFAP